MDNIKKLILQLLYKKGKVTAQAIIAEVLNQRYGSPASVRQELVGLKKNELVENPEFGQYRLSTSGTAFLLEKYPEITREKQSTMTLQSERNKIEEEDMETKEIRKQLLELKNKFGREKLLSELKEVIAFME